jgi:DNA-binding transcriptional MerR regulator
MNKEKKMDQQVLLTKSEAAKIIGCTPANVALLEKSGKLPVAVKTPSGVRLFDEKEVKRFAVERNTRARQ